MNQFEKPMGEMRLKGKFVIDGEITRRVLSNLHYNLNEKLRALQTAE
jgi:hypothetical protein